MDMYMDAVSTFLGHAADFLDDASLTIFLRAIDSNISEDELGTFFESRCFSEGYAVRIERNQFIGPSCRINFNVLYKLHTGSHAHTDPNLCYVQVGDVLLSIPVTNVAIADMVGHIYSTVRLVIGRQFILYHMSADGSPGHECVPGQSGSRFVVGGLTDLPDESMVPLSPRSRQLSRRSRRRSLQQSRVLCLGCAANPGSATVRGRQSLRDSSEVHTYRHYLFRSHSADRPRCVRSHEGDSTRPKILNLFFSTGNPAGTDEASTAANQSRWTLPGIPGGQNQIPNSSMFVFHSPIDFDINKLRIPISSSIQSPSVGLNDSSPQSTPFSRDLTPAFNETSGRPSTLLSVIQDLISRRVLTEGVTVEVPVERAVRSMSAQFDTLFGIGNVHRQREELRKTYAPLNAHVVSRTVAIAELAKSIIGEQELEELLALADAQGFKDRPLLVQLSRGQFKRLAPRDVRVSAYMLGPTDLLTGGAQLPLPEHRQGSLALDRFNIKFSQKYLANTVWRVRVRLQDFTHPVVVGGSSFGIENLTAEDCMLGFKLLSDRSVIVTKWDGLITVSDSIQFLISREATVSDLVTAFKAAVKLKHGLRWEDITVDLEGTENLSSSLKTDLHWTASEYLIACITREGKFVLKRAFDQPFSFSENILDEKSDSLERDEPHTVETTLESRMLWDVVMSDEWNSDTTRNVLSQWAARESESEVPDSPTGRRRKLMAKIAAGGPVNRQDVEELGVDLNTEYTRWWVDDDGEVEQARSSSSKWGRLAAKKKVTISLPPPSIDIQNETVSSPQSRPSLTSPKLSPPTSPKTQKTPLSPVSRSRRQSTLFEEEPRVLRATRDTRQFEFHPFDPNLMITGSRSGVITLIDAEHDLALMETRVDSSPILGLSWLRAHMNMALYGASSSGLVGIVKVGTTKIDYQPIGRFQNLSSVSINCTDDYFIVSGFSRDVSLFDLVSGKKVSEFKEIHSNFINITRFANFSPHLLATSSFDSTCKLWDLRKPATSAVASYTTPSLNVMCCFSPLDENLLVSGLDANLVQLSVKTGLKPNIRQEVLTASVQARNSSSNYRRAVYTADGSRFITSGTDENFMRVIDSTTGASHGICRFDGLLDTFEERLKLKTPGYKAVKQDFGPHAGIAEPGSGKTTEYIQSLRGHPIFTKEVGVLLYPFDRTRSSFVCTTKIPVSTAN